MKKRGTEKAAKDGWSQVKQSKQGGKKDGGGVERKSSSLSSPFFSFPKEEEDCGGPSRADCRVIPSVREKKEKNRGRGKEDDGRRRSLRRDRLLSSRLYLSFCKNNLSLVPTAVGEEEEEKDEREESVLFSTRRKGHTREEKFC